MSVIEYKTELGDLCKVKFTISMPDSEREIQFSEWLSKYARTLPTNKNFKDFGRRYYSKREINKKDDWFAFHVTLAISALSIFLHSYNY